MDKRANDSIYKAIIHLIKTHKIMKKIYEWALGQCGVNDRIINAVNMLKAEHAERFVEVVVGCEIKNDDVPKEVTYEDKVCKLVSCNYILDIVTYTCVDSTTRYFATQEDADKYAEHGDYAWSTSSSDAKEEYPFKGVWTRECEHSTWYERWYSWANKPM